jgi:hypothetical protein
MDFNFLKATFRRDHKSSQKSTSIFAVGLGCYRHNFWSHVKTKLKNLTPTRLDVLCTALRVKASKHYRHSVLALPITSA